MGHSLFTIQLKDGSNLDIRCVLVKCGLLARIEGAILAIGKEQHEAALALNYNTYKEIKRRFALLQSRRSYLERELKAVKAYLFSLFCYEIYFLTGKKPNNRRQRTPTRGPGDKLKVTAKRKPNSDIKVPMIEERTIAIQRL